MVDVGERINRASFVPDLNHIGDEITTIELFEILQLFAGADKTCWNSKFVLNGNDDSAFAAAIKFGRDQAGQSNGLVKLARLGEGVSTGGGIDNQQCFMWRLRVILGETALYLT